MNNNNHDPIAVPRPTLDTNADIRRVMQSGAGTDFSEEASNRRLATVAAESGKFTKCRDEAKDIASTAERLAAALCSRSRTEEPR
jgi:hypothetical protein